MANANEIQQNANVTIDLFGGLVTDPDPTDLPQGVSPSCQDVSFLQGSVSTRPGLSRLFSPAAQFNYGRQFSSVVGGYHQFDFANFGNLASLYINGDWSAGVWVKFPTGANGSILSFGCLGDSSPSGHFAYLLNVTSDGAAGYNILYSHDSGTSAGIVSMAPVIFATHIQANVWTYIGISRSASSQTVTLFVGNGQTVSTFATQPYTLPVNTASMGSDPSFQLGTANVIYFQNPPGPGYFSPELVILANVYMWSRQTTQPDHVSAMNGTPPTSSLIFNCAAQNTPVVSTTALTGTLTATLNGSTIVSTTATFPSPMVFAETYTLPNGTPTTLMVGTDGNLYEQPSIASKTVNMVSAGAASFVPAGSLVKSTVYDTREYIASFNTTDPGGASAPAIWDGTNLTRLTQDGPAIAPVVSEQSLNVPITSISQPPAIGVLPATSALSMGTTVINFFENKSGVYTGTGIQTNPTPYTGGTSLTFNQLIANFPVSGVGNVHARSPMSQQQQGASGQWTGDTFFPESARISTDGYGFDCNIQTTLHVTTSGTYTFYILIDDGWNFFLGNAATGSGTVTYISGPRVGTEASSQAGNTFIASRNVLADSGRTWDTVVVSFSAPGTYPLELGWSNWSAGPQCYVEFSWALGSAPVAGGRSAVGNPLLPTAAAGSVTCTEAGSTVTVVCPVAHPFGVGDTALLANFNVAGYNGLQIVTSVPSPVSFTFTANLTGLAIGTGGTVAPVTATCVTSSPHGLLVDAGVVVTGNSESKYNNSYDDTLNVVINPGSWVVKAVIDAYTFQFDCLENAGDVGTGGNLSCGGQLAPGTHKCCVFYELADGSFTAPSPLATFNSSGNTKITVYNLPIGTPNTVARCVAFTAADGGNFFYIPTDIIGTQSTLGGVTMPALVGTSTRVPDNFSLSATFDFSDSTLLAATGIDIPGNNLFAQVTLAPCQGVISYADRLFVWGEWNKVQNFLGMSMSAQYVNSPATPAGWISYGTGTQTTGNLNQYAYTITGDGSQNAIGVIAQGCYEDANNVPILKPNTTYRWRAFVQVSAVPTVASTLILDITGSTSTAISSANFDLTTATTAGSWVTATFAPLPAAIPSASVLRVYEVGLPAGTTVSISEIQIIPDNQPIITNQMRGSYAFNPTGFDSVTGLLKIPGNQPITDCFVYKDQLYIATPKSLYYTTDSGTEPSGWVINEVSNKVGAISPRACDGTDSGYFLANRSGVYLLDGNDPDIVSNEIKRTWDRINWSASKLIWLKHDVVERMLYIGIPVDGSTSINMVLTCSFRSCQTGDIPNPIHVTLAGKIDATENARKWAPWSLSALCGQKLVTATDEQMSFGLAGVPQVYTLSAANLHDDDATTPIPAMYQTYFLMGSDDEAQYNLGSHRHLVQYVTASAAGTGNLLVTPYVNSLQNARRPLKQQPLISPDIMYDIEMPANVLGERTSLLIQAVPLPGSLDAHFQIRKLTVSLSADQLTPISGRV